jgi:hypothetical protein
LGGRSSPWGTKRVQVFEERIRNRAFGRNSTPDTGLDTNGFRVNRETFPGQEPAPLPDPIADPSTGAHPLTAVEFPRRAVDHGPEQGEVPVDCLRKRTRAGDEAAGDGAASMRAGQVEVGPRAHMATSVAKQARTSARSSRLPAPRRPRFMAPG